MACQLVASRLDHASSLCGRVPNICRQFFETLYAMLIAVLDESFQRLNKKADIEREVSTFRAHALPHYAACNSVHCARASLSHQNIFLRVTSTSNLNSIEYCPDWSDFPHQALQPVQAPQYAAQVRQHAYAAVNSYKLAVQYKT